MHETTIPTYSRHARQRMRERNVSEDDVEEILRLRSNVFPGKRGRTNIMAEVNGRLLRVTVPEDVPPHHIITIVAGEEE